MREPVVYAVQAPGREIDLTPALEFGSLEYLIPDPYAQVTMDATGTANRVDVSLRKFDPERDYLLAIGDPVAIGIACAVTALKFGGRFRILKWDRKERKYYPTYVNLEKWR